MAGYMTIYLVPREEKMIRGLWCPKCLLPSGYELSFDRISDHGVTPNCMLMRKCHDCNSPILKDVS